MINSLYECKRQVNANPVTYKNYIKFNGEGIILPFTQNADYTIRCIFYDKEYIANTCVTGNTGGYSQGQYLALYNNNYDVGTGSGYSSFGAWSEGEHLYINNDINNQSSLDMVHTASYTPVTNNHKYTLGCRENNTLGYYGYIASFKIYSKSEGTLLHDLRPCQVLNIAAFHDVVDDKLYLNDSIIAVDDIE